MVTVLLGAVLICRVFQAVFVKNVSNAIRSSGMLFRYYALQNALSALLGLLALMLSGEKLRFDRMTLLLSLLFAFALFLAQVSSVLAIRLGTISLNSMAGTAGMLVPVLTGALFFDEKVSPLQLLALAVFFLSMWFLISSTKKSSASFDVRSVFFLALGLLANGTTMLAQQLFSRTVTDGSISLFSVLSFSLIAVFTGVSSLFMKREKNLPSSGRSLAVSAVILAAALFLINQISTYLAATVSPIILFAFISGGGTVISAIVASLVYREKMNLRIALSIVFGIASLIAMKLFSI